MAHPRHFTDDERAEIEHGIENVFAFVQDVLDDPSVLDDLPERAAIELTPRADRDAARTYAAETRRFVVSIDSPDKGRSNHTA